MPSPPRGRYAPSPTGWLHLGNALGAVLTVARARALGGRCVLRLEDLDRPREKPGAADAIRRDLHDLGLRFDADVPRPGLLSADLDDDGVLIQSRRDHAYAAACQRLADDGLLYACRCSRKDLAQAASAPHVGEEGPAYPGTCRALGLPLDTPNVAWRVRVDHLIARFGAPVVVDAWQGPITQDLEREVGDVVVRRRDGLFAYQLAVVVDDDAQQITEVVRGVDLLSSAPRQALLHTALGHPPPSFAHFPLVVDADGKKLSKREPSAPALLRTLLDDVGPAEALRTLLRPLAHAAGDTSWIDGIKHPDDVVARLDRLEPALRQQAIHMSAGDV